MRSVFTRERVEGGSMNGDLGEALFEWGTLVGSSVKDTVYAWSNNGRKASQPTQ